MFSPCYNGWSGNKPRGPIQGVRFRPFPFKLILGWDSCCFFAEGSWGHIPLISLSFFSPYIIVPASMQQWFKHAFKRICCSLGIPQHHRWIIHGQVGLPNRNSRKDHFKCGLWPSQMLTCPMGRSRKIFEIYGNLGAHPRFQKEILGWPQGSPKIMGILMKQVRYIISLYRLYNHTCHIIHSWKRKSNKKHQHLWLTFRLTSISPSTPEHHLFLLPKSLGPSALSSHPALTHFTTAGYWNMTNSTCPQHGNKKPNRKLPTKLYKTW